MLVGRPRGDDFSASTCSLERRVAFFLICRQEGLLLITCVFVLSAFPGMFLGVEDRRLIPRLPPE